jgi:hypothetical protein
MVEPVVTPRVSQDPLEAAVAAALILVEDRPWAQVTLRDVARTAGLSFAEVYALAPTKAALVAKLSRRLDRGALALIEGEEASDLHDRLFEAVMSRLEVMAPHRAALLAIALAEPAAVAPNLPRTARALLEAVGIDTGGRKGAFRIAAMTGVWARTLQVWRDDEGALNRTMAEIDRRLRQMRDGLKRLGAGF